MKIAHLSTRVLITASVSSTRPSTFCFFRRGSWGPRPRLGGRTGSRGRLPLTSGGSEFSTRLSCLRGATPSSTSLSSLHTQLFPMAPRPTRFRHNWTDHSCSTVSCRTCARLLLAQKAIQVATIISLGEAPRDGLRGDVYHHATADHQQLSRKKPRSQSCIQQASYSRQRFTPVERKKPSKDKKVPTSELEAESWKREQLVSQHSTPD